MIDQPPLHRLYHHYSELPYSQRALYTAMLITLGFGYLFALLNVYFTYAGKAGGNPWLLTEQDLVVAYSGSGTVSRLEGALRGPMSTMLPPEERTIVIDWVHAGADRAAYERDVRPIIEKRCLTCHDGSNPHIPNLFGFDNIKKVTESDTGAKLSTLVRVSHIHMFGIPFIFFIVGLIFSHAYVRPVWFKCAVIALPFLSVMVDVSSWYMIKVYHPFAWVEILAGMLLAACFAFMWLVALYQMWLSPPPAMVTERLGGDLPNSRLPKPGYALGQSANPFSTEPPPYPRGPVPPSSSNRETRSELMKNVSRSIFMVTIAALLVASASIPSEAAHRAARTRAFDGVWSVVIYTLYGDCDRALRYSLRIYDGRVDCNYGFTKFSCGRADGRPASRV